MSEELVIRGLPDGKTMLELCGGGEQLSHVVIRPMTLRYAAAVVRAVYIGGVETREAWRGRGFARRLITAALDRERAGDAAVALLYGIGDFYHRFGYATLGAEHGLALRHPEQGAVLPAGWRVRAAREDDLPAIRRLYDAEAVSAVMRKVRQPDDPAWAQLAALLRGEREGDACRVVQGPDGNVVAYAWLGRGCWTVDHAQERYWPQDLFIGEAVAAGHAAADAVLAACRMWGGGGGRAA
ncbi:MAG: hypothetical protein AVDCRST_MAG77-3064 [uncultured Chloroflexi bacterium]|uniref:N-acetyltransferase domain-containing protein n=1 Tax=uncultured Chloroflexota bacterium TaxID=166587 RepID=A0A6J4J5T0_9CHLR|nr:MAG: hypothetical protein AVDCRST_MAG77-3064 [uncultured Chloroflexota bacterium]